MIQTFSKSDLILNADKSVYHLHLKPEHISSTIITVGDPDRVQLVSQFFDYIEFKLNKREFVTHTGFIGNKRLTVISTGIGTDNIDIVLNELHLLANYNFNLESFRNPLKPLYIIRIGTSGTIQPDIPINSHLISDHAIGIDNLMQFYSFSETNSSNKLLEKFKLHCYFNHTIHPYLGSCSSSLVSYFEKDFLHGITLTSPGFYGPQGRKINTEISMQKFFEDIKTFQYNDLEITNIEMETAGLYGLGTLLGHHCISCNAILANRSTGEFSNDSEKCVVELIKKVLAIVNKIPD